MITESVNAGEISASPVCGVNHTQNGDDDVKIIVKIDGKRYTVLIALIDGNIECTIYRWLMTKYANANFRINNVYCDEEQQWVVVASLMGLGGMPKAKKEQAKPVCRVCQSNKHLMHECPNRKPSNEVENRTKLFQVAMAKLAQLPKCDKCGGKHQTQFCAEIARQEKNKNGPVDSNSDNVVHPFKCTNCQARGHLAKDCTAPARSRKVETRNTKGNSKADKINQSVEEGKLKEKGYDDAERELAREERNRIKEEETGLLNKKKEGNQDNANDVVESFTFCHDCLDETDMPTFARRINTHRLKYRMLWDCNLPIMVWLFLDVVCWNICCLVVGYSMIQFGCGMAWITTVVGTMYHGQNFLIFCFVCTVMKCYRAVAKTYRHRLVYKVDEKSVVLEPDEFGRRFSQHTVPWKIKDQFADVQVSEEAFFIFENIGVEMRLATWKYGEFKVSMESFYNHAQCTTDYTSDKVNAVELYQNIKKDPFIMRSRKTEAMNDLVQGTADLCMAWRLKCKEKQYLSNIYEFDFASVLTCFRIFLETFYHWILLCSVMLIVLNELLKRVPNAAAADPFMASVPVAAKVYTYVSWDYQLPVIKLHSMLNNFSNYYWRFNDKTMALASVWDEKMPSIGMTINPLAWPGVCAFVAHAKDPFTTIMGGQHRVAKDAPVISARKLANFRDYIVRTLQSNCDFFDDYDQPSLEEWLDGASYSEGMKDVMRAYDATKHDVWTGLEAKYTDCTGFIKSEAYPELKWSRTIRARSKKGGIPGVYARVNKVLEKSLFKLRCFIKKVKFPDRPAYMENKFYDSQLVMSDFTGYEGLFTKSVQQVIQFAIMDTLMAGLSDWQTRGPEIKDMISKHGRTTFSLVSDWMSGKKKSGEQDTSSSNGGVNALTYGFIQWDKYGLEFDEIQDELVVEGDDMTSQCIGREPTADDYFDVGLDAKIEYAGDVAESKFCQIVVAEGQFIIDPIKFLAKFGLNDKKYANARKNKHMANARAKALSTMAMVNGCPVVSKFCEKILYWTRSYNVSERLLRENTKFMFKDSGMVIERRYAAKASTPVSYHVTSRVFNIDVSVLELIESKIDSCECIGDLAELNCFFPVDWVTNWQDKVRTNTKAADYVLGHAMPEQFGLTFDPFNKRRRKLVEIDSFESVLNQGIIDRDWVTVKKCGEAILRRRKTLTGAPPTLQVVA